MMGDWKSSVSSSVTTEGDMLAANKICKSKTRGEVNMKSGGSDKLDGQFLISKFISQWRRRR